MSIYEPGNMYFRGPWKYCENYDPGDVVKRAGAFFLCLRQNAGNDPIEVVSENYWEHFAAEGSGLLFRGVYRRLETLREKYPTDVAGACAIVITAGEMRIFYWNDVDQEWQSISGGGSTVGGPEHSGLTGRELPGQHPMGAITGLEEAFVLQGAELAAEIEARETAIANEASARREADDGLEGVIELETQARQNAIAALEGAIAAEEQTRTAAMEAEALIRENADVMLKEQINAEMLARQGADTALQGAIDAVTGKLRYMPAKDFGAGAPGQGVLSAWAMAHTGLDHVANSTAVINLFDNHEWIYNEVGDEWIDNGLGSVATATDAALGVVMGTDEDGGVSVDPDGTMRVNKVPVKQGGTGAATEEEARNNLGLADAITSPNGTIKHIIALTDEEYEALTNPDVSTLYVVGGGGNTP